MEVSHDDESDDAGDDTKKFDAIKAVDPAADAIADLSIKNDYSSASCEDDNA